MRRWTFLLITVTLVFATTALAGSSANYQLSNWTLGASVQSATSLRYTLAEVIAQPVIGHAASTTYQACYGYRCGTVTIPPAIVPARRTVYLPVVLRDYNSNVDRYEPDDHAAQAEPIAADGSVQLRNFYPAGDVDWVRLPIGPGTYVIATSVNNNVYPDTVLVLYAANGMTPLATNDDCTPYTRASCLTYTSSVSTTLYLKVSPYDASSVGPDSWYRLAVVKQ